MKRPTVTVNSETFYSIQYISEHFVTNRKQSNVRHIVDETLKLKPIVIEGHHLYYSMNQVYMIKSYVNKYTQLKSVPKPRDSYTVREILNSINDSSIAYKQVYNYIKKMGFEPIARGNIGNAPVNYYDRGVRQSCINHFGPKQVSIGQKGLSRKVVPSLQSENEYLRSELKKANERYKKLKDKLIYKEQ